MFNAHAANSTNFLLMMASCLASKQLSCRRTPGLELTLVIIIQLLHQVVRVAANRFLRQRGNAVPCV
jgi:hypothetical protein